MSGKTVGGTEAVVEGKSWAEEYEEKHNYVWIRTWKDYQRFIRKVRGARDVPLRIFEVSNVN